MSIAKEIVYNIKTVSDGYLVLRMVSRNRLKITSREDIGKVIDAEVVESSDSSEAIQNW